MYHCILLAASECIIHMHRYPRVCMCVCLTYINIHIRSTLLSHLYARTDVRVPFCEKQRNILDLRKKRKKKRRGNRENGARVEEMSEAVNARQITFSEFPKRDTPLSRASISRNEGHIHSLLAHIAFARATTTTRIDFYIYTHTRARTPAHTHIRVSSTRRQRDRA